MKLTKKLLPALGMLALSACMLVTSTFAWFSMNDVVKATNMAISAKGDQVYLQIINPNEFVKDSEGNNTQDKVIFLDGAAQTVADLTATTAPKLKPTNVKLASVSGDSTTYAPYAGGVPTWVTATSYDSEHAYQVSGYSAIDNPTDYYLMSEVKIRLDPTAGGLVAAGTLRVSEVKFSADTTEADGTYTVDALGQCVSVLVACTVGETTQAQLYKQTGSNGKFTQVGGENFLAGTLKDGTYFFDNSTTGVTVKIYVFFDGDNAKCTLTNLAAATLTNAYSVNVSFTVTGDSATTVTHTPDSSTVAQAPNA